MLLFALLTCLILPDEPDRPSITVVLRADLTTELAPHGRGNVYAPCIHIEHDRWQMWYGAQGKDGHDRIHLAESMDGNTWIKRGVVLDDPTANHVNDPCVIKYGNTYWMYYTRAERGVVDAIHAATSEDGIRWKPRGEVLAAGAPGAWDALLVGRPSAIAENGRVRMWYDGRKDFPVGSPIEGVPTSAVSQRHVGLAESPDGLHFQRMRDIPVFGHDAGGIHVEIVGRGYVMVYESREGTRWANSGDGVTWTDRGILVGKSSRNIDAFGHVTPALVRSPSRGQFVLFVGTAAASTWDQNSIACLPVDFEPNNLPLD